MRYVLVGVKHYHQQQWAIVIALVLCLAAPRRAVLSGVQETPSHGDCTLCRIFLFSRSHEICKCINAIVTKTGKSLTATLLLLQVVYRRS